MLGSFAVVDLSSVYGYERRQYLAEGNGTLYGNHGVMACVRVYGRGVAPLASS